jgi:Uma2 family endonuclease
MPFAATLPRHRLTVEDFQRMAEVGILHPEERVELLEGELIQMAPIGDYHAGMVNWLTNWFVLRRFPGKMLLC